MKYRVITNCLLCLSITAFQSVSANELYIHGTVYAKKDSGQLVPQYFENMKDRNKAHIMYVTIQETGTRTPTKIGGSYRLNVKSFKAGDQITLDVKKPGWKVTSPLNGLRIIPRNSKATTDIILERVNSSSVNEKFIYSVQLLNIQNENKAQSLKRDLLKDYNGKLSVYIEKYMVNNMPNNGYEYKVKIGEFPNKDLAEQLRYGLSKRYKKLEGAFITLKDHK